MDGSSNESRNDASRFMNPWVLHFQKMALELKCPLCLSFFDEPVLLPCNHLFCRACVPFAAKLGSACPLCEARFVDRDTRAAPFVDKMVSIYRSLDATFSAHLSKLVPSGKCKEFEGCSVTVDCKGENVDMEGGKGGCRKHEEFRISLVNQADQMSADSPPSSGDGKASDESSDEYRCLGSENALDRRSVLTNADDKLQLLNCMSTASEHEGHLRDPKRQKKLNYDQLPSLGVDCVDLAHSAPAFGSSMASNCDVQFESHVAVASNGSSVDEDDEIVKNAKCAFCQSTKVSEATGPILHYLNGSLVAGTEAGFPNVIHVHKICVEWAPQVYYEGDKIQNLKAEVARGSKLKCSKCGQKGAALGCYLSSCQRSYHIPCALEIQNCRWDEENFLLLCPSHSSVKFPDEKSKSKKMPRTQALPCQMNPHSASTWVSPGGEKKWILCGSALSAEERNILVKFAKTSGATVSKFWKPDVTHVIASTDENGACTRTYKVLMGILNGTWILKIDWVKEYMKDSCQCPVNEEAYEIALDNYGCVDGPKSGRMRVLNNTPKLFTGLSFYFSGDFPPAYKEDLQDLVIAAGGNVAETEERLAGQNCDNPAPAPSKLVVYNLDSPGRCKVGEEVSILWQRLNEAEGVAAKVGAQVVGHTWLVESIAACNLQPFLSCC